MSPGISTAKPSIDDHSLGIDLSIKDIASYKITKLAGQQNHADEERNCLDEDPRRSSEFLVMVTHLPCHLYILVNNEG